MRRADSTTSVAVKVLPEKDMIAEIRIVVHFAVEIITSAFALFVAEEYVGQTLLSDMLWKKVTCCNSLATARRDIELPLPVGHSIWKSLR